MASIKRSIPSPLRSLVDPYRSPLLRWPLEGTRGVVTFLSGTLRPTTHLDNNDPEVRQRLLSSNSDRRARMDTDHLVRDLKKALGEAQKRGETTQALHLARLLTEALRTK